MRWHPAMPVTVAIFKTLQVYHQGQAIGALLGEQQIGNPADQPGRQIPAGFDHLPIGLQGGEITAPLVDVELSQKALNGRVVGMRGPDP
jgi:hypothetical protein